MERERQREDGPAKGPTGKKGKKFVGAKSYTKREGTCLDQLGCF
jgi:hypothetical protein